MDLMVNPRITKFAQNVDGEITVLKINDEQDAYAQIFAKGAESGSAKLENNKSATINVSTYTQSVEITPTSGKTAMKKVTITLSNIPSLKLFAFGDAEGVVYLTEIPASDGTVTAYVPSTTGLEATEGAYAEATGVTISGTAYARYADGDITF